MPCASTAERLSHSVRDLNDTFRQTFFGGRVIATPGICDLPDATRIAVLEAVMAFHAFDEGNDPYGEHDFGTIEIEGHRCFWKIDAYDNDLLYGSPDPSDPDVTTRVLTIMLAEEY